MVSNRSLCRLGLSSFATRSFVFEAIERLALGSGYTPERVPVFSSTHRGGGRDELLQLGNPGRRGGYGVAPLTFAWCFWNAASIFSNCTLSMSPLLSPVHDQASTSVPL